MIKDLILNNPNNQLQKHEIDISSLTGVQGLATVIKELTLEERFKIRDIVDNEGDLNNRKFTVWYIIYSLYSVDQSGNMTRVFDDSDFDVVLSIPELRWPDNIINQINEINGITSSGAKKN
jgi:hypothetical protein